LMLKSDLAKRIANKNLYRRDAENVVNAMIEAISAALARGNRVEIQGFGVFSVRHRRSRIGRNPRSQTAVNVEKRAFPYFKSGKEIRERLKRSPT
jgi:integration host factor subunit beta